MSDGVRERVEAALRAFMHAATDQLRAIGDELIPVAEAASEFVLDGGKRLRPAFCFWGALAAGGEDSEALIHAAASLELLQACALVHDDLIDHSDTRRGRPAVHQRFTDLHRVSGWHGDAADFGAAAAILLGDVLLAWSEEMFLTSGLHDGALRRGQPICAAMRTEVMAGQYLDVVEQARGGTTVERALRVARLKSAKYTVERPLHLGGAIGRAGEEVLRAYSAFGLPLGEAFQLRDDLLGVFGDPAVTGKPAGDDLREGKQTVLTALAMQRAPAADRDLLTDVLGRSDLTNDDVVAARAAIDSCGATAEVETMISTRLDDAVAALDGVTLEPIARDALVTLAGAASYRHG
ncbi:MAG TPA: polyprenyl synthetase family protein [Mycobacteriales bacterium]|nr:polyprenyl synthetase family protein [Mycobacteriales bacterium]HVX69308.1 polyprenyl synthetase family protein [Mycobacteriales bacterium]